MRLRRRHVCRHPSGCTATTDADHLMCVGHRDAEQIPVVASGNRWQALDLNRPTPTRDHVVNPDRPVDLNQFQRDMADLHDRIRQVRRS